MISSKDGKPTDFMIAWMNADDNTPRLMDYHSTPGAGYTMPTLDTPNAANGGAANQLSIDAHAYNETSGAFSITFTRPLAAAPGDLDDRSITLGTAQTVLWALNPDPAARPPANGSDIVKHTALSRGQLLVDFGTPVTCSMCHGGHSFRDRYDALAGACYANGWPSSQLQGYRGEPSAIPAEWITPSVPTPSATPVPTVSSTPTPLPAGASPSGTPAPRIVEIETLVSALSSQPDCLGSTVSGSSGFGYASPGGRGSIGLAPADVLAASAAAGGGGDGSPAPGFPGGVGVVVRAVQTSSIFAQPATALVARMTYYFPGPSAAVATATATASPGAAAGAGAAAPTTGSTFSAAQRAALLGQHSIGGGGSPWMALSWNDMPGMGVGMDGVTGMDGIVAWLAAPSGALPYGASSSAAGASPSAGAAANGAGNGNATTCSGVLACGAAAFDIYSTAYALPAADTAVTGGGRNDVVILAARVTGVYASITVARPLGTGDFRADRDLTAPDGLYMMYAYGVDAPGASIPGAPLNFSYHGEGRRASAPQPLPFSGIAAACAASNASAPLASPTAAPTAAPSRAPPSASPAPGSGPASGGDGGGLGPVIPGTQYAPVPPSVAADAASGGLVMQVLQAAGVSPTGPPVSGGAAAPLQQVAASIQAVTAAARFVSDPAALAAASAAADTGASGSASKAEVAAAVAGWRSIASGSDGRFTARWRAENSSVVNALTYGLQYAAVPEPTLFIRLTSTVGGWVALGLNTAPAMAGADILVAWAAPAAPGADSCGDLAACRVYAADTRATGMRRPLPDTTLSPSAGSSNVVVLDASVAPDGAVAITLARKLRTGDALALDRDLIADAAASTPLYVLFAWGGSAGDFDTGAFSEHSAAGGGGKGYTTQAQSAASLFPLFSTRAFLDTAAALGLDAANSGARAGAVAAVTVDSSFRAPAYTSHAALMIAGFWLCMVLGASAARYRSASPGLLLRPCSRSAAAAAALAAQAAAAAAPQGPSNSPPASSKDLTLKTLQLSGRGGGATAVVPVVNPLAAVQQQQQATLVLAPTSGRQARRSVAPAAAAGAVRAARLSMLAPSAAAASLVEAMASKATPAPPPPALPPRLPGQQGRGSEGDGPTAFAPVPAGGPAAGAAPTAAASRRARALAAVNGRQSLLPPPSRHGSVAVRAMLSPADIAALGVTATAAAADAGDAGTRDASAAPAALAAASTTVAAAAARMQAAQAAQQAQRDAFAAQGGIGELGSSLNLFAHNPLNSLAAAAGATVASAAAASGSASGAGSAPSSRSSASSRTPTPPRDDVWGVSDEEEGAEAAAIPDTPAAPATPAADEGAGGTAEGVLQGSVAAAASLHAARGAAAATGAHKRQQAAAARAANGGLAGCLRSWAAKDRWFLAHVGLQLAGVALACAALAIVLHQHSAEDAAAAATAAAAAGGTAGGADSGESDGDSHWGVHQIAGVAALTAMFTQLLLGGIRPSPTAPLRPLWLAAHDVAALAAFLSAAVAVPAGLAKAELWNATTAGLMALHILGCVAVATSGELVLRLPLNAAASTAVCAIAPVLRWALLHGFCIGARVGKRHGGSSPASSARCCGCGAQKRIARRQRLSWGPSSFQQGAAAPRGGRSASSGNGSGVMLSNGPLTLAALTPGGASTRDLIINNSGGGGVMSLTAGGGLAGGLTASHPFNAAAAGEASDGNSGFSEGATPVAPKLLVRGTLPGASVGFTGPAKMGLSDGSQRRGRGTIYVGGGCKRLAASALALGVCAIVASTAGLFAVLAHSTVAAPAGAGAAVAAARRLAAASASAADLSLPLPVVAWTTPASPAAAGAGQTHAAASAASGAVTAGASGAAAAAAPGTKGLLGTMPSLVDVFGHVSQPSQQHGQASQQRGQDSQQHSQPSQQRGPQTRAPKAPEAALQAGGQQQQQPSLRSSSSSSSSGAASGTTATTGSAEASSAGGDYVTLPSGLRLSMGHAAVPASISSPASPHAAAFNGITSGGASDGASHSAAGASHFAAAALGTGYEGHARRLAVNNTVPPGFNATDAWGAFPINRTANGGTLDICYKFDAYPVPARETSYVCRVFAFPPDIALHVIEAEAMIDAYEVNHHMILFQLQNDADYLPTGADLAGHAPCDTMPNVLAPVALWAPGSTVFTFPAGTGLRVGADAARGANASPGMKYGVLQIHYNNPSHIMGLLDSSGFSLRVKPFDAALSDAGFMFFGAMIDKLRLPANKRNVGIRAVCARSLSSMIPPASNYAAGAQGYTVVTSFLHMHMLGLRIWQTLMPKADRYARKLVNGTDPLGHDDAYNYAMQTAHMTNAVFQPGDEFQLFATFDTTPARGMAYGNADAAAGLPIS
jgi:hypothetical protein